MDAKWIVTVILVPLIGVIGGAALWMIKDISKRVTILERRVEVIFERVDNQVELNKALNEQIRTITNINTKIIERIDARKGSLDTLNKTISDFLQALLKNAKV